MNNEISTMFQHSLDKKEMRRKIDGKKLSKSFLLSYNFSSLQKYFLNKPKFYTTNLFNLKFLLSIKNN